MPKPKVFKWTVEFTVSENWVADGFELTEGRAQSMIMNVLRDAYEREVSARIVRAPHPAEIRKAQGVAE